MQSFNFRMKVSAFLHSKRLELSIKGPWESFRKEWVGNGENVNVQALSSAASLATRKEPASCHATRNRKAKATSTHGRHNGPGAAQQQLSRSLAAPARRRSHLVDDAVHHEGVLQDVLPGPGIEEDA